jgi:hypothetical protein
LTQDVSLYHGGNGRHEVRRADVVVWLEAISDTVIMVNDRLHNEIRRPVQASSGLTSEQSILAGIIEPNRKSARPGRLVIFHWPIGVD